MRRSLIAVLAVLVVALSPVGSAAATVVDDGRTFDAGHRLCRTTDARIDESSGIATSSTVPGAYWTHNDSGDSSRWFLVSGGDCHTIATYKLDAPDVDGGVGGEHPLAFDWEDMTRGVDAAGKPTLLFGDIGDNQQARTTKTVYEVAEPDGTLPAGATPLTEQPVSFVVHTLVLPIAPVDSETLLFVRQTRQLGLVTKPRDLTTGLDYTGKSQLLVSAVGLASTTGPVPLSVVGAIDFTALPRQNPTDTNSIAATSGDVAPDGRQLVVRAYYDAYEWPVGPAYDLGAAVTATPLHIPLMRTRQGEGITYGDGPAGAGRSLFTTTEGTGLDGDPTSGVLDRYDLVAAAAPALPEQRWPVLGLMAAGGLAVLVSRRRRA